MCWRCFTVHSRYRRKCLHDERMQWLWNEHWHIAHRCVESQ